jgi:membrane protein DedA with SNARE-associated domain
MTLLALILAFRYPAIFIGAFIEGPILMTATGFLYSLGYFSLIPAFFALLFGDLVGDVAWYAVGYYAAHPFLRKFGKYFNLSENSIERVKLLYKKYDSKILIASKLTMGFGFAAGVLMAAGMSKVPLKKFVVLNFLGGLVWTAFLMSLGYVFGNIYQQVSEGLRIATIVFYLVIFLLAIQGFSRYMRKKINEKNLNL